MTLPELPKKKNFFFSEKLEKNPEREMTQNPKPKSALDLIGGPGQQGQI